MSFHIGQQLVCVNDAFSTNETWRWAVRTFPQVKSVYTIREIRTVDDIVGFCFCEIVNPQALFCRGGAILYREPAFHSKNFRPVKLTSIEVFERLLAPLESPGTSRRKVRT